MITYWATNTENGKFYVGSTDNFERRKKQHLNSKENYPFQNSLRKNPDAFEWETWCDDSDERILEQALLDEWFGKEQCYNLCASVVSPMRGRNHREDSKEKIRKAKEGKKVNLSEDGRKRKSDKMLGSGNPNFGMPGRFLGCVHTEETKRKMRQPCEKKRKPKSEDHKQKIKESRTGKFWWVNSEDLLKSSKNCPGDGWQRGKVWRGKKP